MALELNESALPSPIPYADPAYLYDGMLSPFHTEKHHRFRRAMRAWIERHLIPNDWDEEVEKGGPGVPRQLLRQAYEDGWLPILVGRPYPTTYVELERFPIMTGLKPEEVDWQIEGIIQDELGRTGSGGVPSAITLGLSVGCPPILHFGSQFLKEKYAKPTLRGEKTIVLAITEPSAGSDVAAIKCTAKKIVEAGKEFYIVNGEKKWITNGIYADFFTTAVRTGGDGMGGISLLVIERSEGVSTRKISTQGLWASGSTFVTFQNVKVPVENLIGKEGKGFSYIVNNFNHERVGICMGGIRNARVCLEDAFAYAMKRRTFGKRLIEHPVIRLKLAHMARLVESTQAWSFYLLFQLDHQPTEKQTELLAGPIALLKAQVSTTYEYVAREAAQIFGGLAYTRGGQGDRVERLYREVRGLAIPGGSEEIMADLGVRQAVANYQKLLQHQ